MTQEDKSLLFQDLSARLPYGVKIYYGNKTYLLSIPYLEDIKNIAFGHEYSRGYNIKNISTKPYLRSMSSMTEEEEIFYNIKYPYIKNYEQLDWLNSHNFDYRGLIEKGLALEAKEGMYSIKEK